MNRNIRFLCALPLAVFVVGFASAQTVKQMPKRQFFESQTAFKAAIKELLNVDLAANSPLYLDGQRIYFDEGPGGKLPQFIVIDWDVGKDEIRILQTEQNGKVYSAGIKSNGGIDQLAAFLPAVPNSADQVNATQTVLKAALAKNLPIDIAEFWEPNKNGLDGKKSDAAGLFKVAYALYRNSYASADYEIAERYLREIIVRSCWSRSLMEEWLAVKEAINFSDTRLEPLIGFLDTRTNQSDETSGTKLAAVAVKPEPQSLSIAISENRTYNRFDLTSVMDSFKQMEIYASERTEASLLYNQALFLSRRDDAEKELSDTVARLTKLRPELARQFFIQNQLDLQSRLSVSGSLSSIGEIGIAAYFKLITE